MPGQNRVVIVSHAFWQVRLAGDPEVVGRVLTLDGVAVEIVGVLTPAFRLPQLPHFSVPNRVDDPFEVLRPMAWSDDYRRSWGEFDNMVIVRQPAGVSVQATAAELMAITTADYAKASIHPYAVATPLMDGITADARRPLWVLLAAVAAALLIACVNVAGLLGTRWTTRQRELAIRTAVGAGRWRLAQVVATESVWLAAAAASSATRSPRRPCERSWHWRRPQSLDSTRWTRHHVPPRDRRRHARLRASVHGRAGLARGAGRSRRHAEGGRADDDARAPLDGHSCVARRWRGCAHDGAARRRWPAGRELHQRAAGRPRVHDRIGRRGRYRAAERTLPETPRRARHSSTRCSRALAVRPAFKPLVWRGFCRSRAMPRSTCSFPRATRTQPPRSRSVTTYRSAPVFALIGLPLLAGRLMTADDDSRRVAVISERTGRTLWPGQDPVGRTFRRGRADSWQVIGIVADAKFGFERDPGLVAYVPYGLNTRNALSLAVRGSGAEATTMASARRVVKELDPDLPLRRLRRLDSVVDDALAMRRFQVRLMTAFGAAGLLLACLGIYGVLSGMVEGRRGELAIRLALGASPARVRQLIIRQGLKP